MDLPPHKFTLSEKSFSKITALWALNEAALGGLLHALNIPFTGLIVGGVASVLITLLAFLSDKKGNIVKATIIVIVIKAVASPYTPIAAFIAVLFQGLLGELLFSSKKFFTLSAILLAILASLYSAIQKLFLLTILFGTTLWKSIDIFFNYIMKQFNFLGADVNFSSYLIALYLMLHLFFGSLFGILAARIPKVLASLTDSSLIIPFERIKNIKTVSPVSLQKKRKLWFQKFSGIIVFLLLIAVLLISYFFSENQNGNSWSILSTIFRAIGITLLWFFFLGPIAMRYFKKLIATNQNKYALEIESILHTLPYYKAIIKECYIHSTDYSGIARVKRFIKLTMINILLFDFYE